MLVVLAPSPFQHQLAPGTQDTSGELGWLWEWAAASFQRGCTQTPPQGTQNPADPEPVGMGAGEAQLPTQGRRHRLATASATPRECLCGSWWAAGEGGPRRQDPVEWWGALGVVFTPRPSQPCSSLTPNPACLPGGGEVPEPASTAQVSPGAWDPWRGNRCGADGEAPVPRDPRPPGSGRTGGKKKSKANDFRDAGAHAGEMSPIFHGRQKHFPGDQFCPPTSPCLNPQSIIFPHLQFLRVAVF